MSNEFEDFVKEHLLLLIDDYEENTKDKKSVDIDTEKLNLIDKYTNYFIDKFEEINEDIKSDLINQALEKIDDMRYEVENL